MPEPGLISRKMLGYHGNTATIREVWDVTAPGCPVIVYRTGTWPFEPIPDARTVERTFRMPLTQWLEIEQA